MTSKSDDYYFKRLLESRNKRSRAFVNKATVSEKAWVASYLVAELHTISENLIMPTCKIIVGKMLGQDQDAL
jgi:hypothetical protein